MYELARKSMATTLALVAALVLAGPAVAQEFGFGGEASGTEAAAGSGAAGAPSVGLSGTLSGALRGLVSVDDLAASALEARAVAGLAVKASLSGAEGYLALSLDPATLQTDPARIVDQAYAGIYAGPVALRAGFMKLTWGKGDDVHVLDVVNPFDYSDFVNRPYAERKIAQLALKVDVATSDRGKLELAYLPVFAADRAPTVGPWAMKRVTDMVGAAHDQIYAQTYEGIVYQAIAGARAKAYDIAFAAAVAAGAPASMAAAAATAAAASVTLETIEAAAPGTTAGLQAQAERMTADTLTGFVVQPDGNRLDKGQAGLRFTETIGGFDFGLQYWYGFLRDPVYDANPAAVAAAGNRVLLDYNRAHRFGADFAFALAGFGFRTEVAFDLTSDLSGDNRLVRNPALGWSAGVDKEILGFRLNVQNLGRYTLLTDHITETYDVEYGMHAVSDTFIADLSRSMLGDKLVVGTAFVFSVDNLDFALMPSVEWSPVDSTTLKLRGTLFGGDASGTYGQFSHNSFVEASLAVSF